MNTHADKTLENKSQTVANRLPKLQSKSESTFQFVDNRPEAIAQRKLQEAITNSPRVQQLKAYHEMANNSPQVSQLRAIQDRATNSPQFSKTAQLQAMADNHSAQQQQPIQKKKNNTGLPDNLKTGMENLSGMSLDDVNVHRNSDKPVQLQAHAYAQGTDIHLGPGQEKHLPHEAWHVVQQKQGRVKPTMQMMGKVDVNDDSGLEKEADVMGNMALQGITSNEPAAVKVNQLQTMGNNHLGQQETLQMKKYPGKNGQQYHIVPYKDVNKTTSDVNNSADFPVLEKDGRYTGHHMIPDHCFKHAKGKSGYDYIMPGYSTDDAPTIIVSADANGGKSRVHGEIHDIFDPMENSIPDGKWTYTKAKQAAIDSLKGIGVNPKSELDSYYPNSTKTTIRAGEHAVWPEYKPKKSNRGGDKAEIDNDNPVTKKQKTG